MAGGRPRWSCCQTSFQNLSYSAGLMWEISGSCGPCQSPRRSPFVSFHDRSDAIRANSYSLSSMPTISANESIKSNSSAPTSTSIHMSSASIKRGLRVLSPSRLILRLRKDPEQHPSVLTNQTVPLATMIPPNRRTRKLNPPTRPYPNGGKVYNLMNIWMKVDWVTKKSGTEPHMSPVRHPFPLRPSL